MQSVGCFCKDAKPSASLRVTDSQRDFSAAAFILKKNGDIWDLVVFIVIARFGQQVYISETEQSKTYSRAGEMLG